MGFLKKKPSIRMPNGSELRSTSSSKPSPSSASASGVTSPKSDTLDNNVDRRDDGSGSGMWTDVESRATRVTGASKTGGGGTAASVTPSRASAASSNREGREKAARKLHAKAEAARNKEASKKETGSSSAAGGSSAKPKKKASHKRQGSTASDIGKGGDVSSAAPSRKSRGSRGLSPISPRLALKTSANLGASLEKKKRHARHSFSPGQKGGKSPGKHTTEAKGTDKDKKKAAAATAKSAKDKNKSVKEKKVKSGQASVRTERVSNNRKTKQPQPPTAPSEKTSSSRKLPSKSPGRRGDKKQQTTSPSRPGSAPTIRSPLRTRLDRRVGRHPSRSTIKKRHQESLDESSFDDDDSSCSSGSYSDEDESLTSYYSDTELDDSTMCTDHSGFVSIGYDNTNSGSMSFTDDDGDSETDDDGTRGSRSTYNTYESSDSKDDADAELSPRSAARSTGGKSNRVGRSSLLGRKKLSKASRESALSTLGDLAAIAKSGMKEKKNGAAVTAIDVNAAASGAKEKFAATPVAPPVDQLEEERAALSDDEDGPDLQELASESSGRGTASHPSNQSNASTLPDFMKRMEGFEVKNQEHQLVVQVLDHGNVEKLLLQELAYIPKHSNPKEVVIKVEASTITLQDCMIRRGKWYEMQSLPFVPGSDFVGVIHDMGDEATKNSTFQVGDKVAAVVPSGGNAKYISLPYHSMIRVPSETDSVVALCLSSAYVPAREALDLARKLNTPFTSANILIIGGNGPSGLATIELALLEGANVFTTADERHHEFLTNMGAKCFPIDPNKWLPTLQGKMDVVLDSVCLDGYDSSSLALNSAGTLVCTGMSAVYTQGQIRAYGMRDVRDYKAMYCKMRAKYMLNNTVYYDRMERFDLAPNEYAQHFRYLCHLAAKDSIKPLVSTRSPLNLVASMQKAIEHGDTTYGVCVCTPWTMKTDSTPEVEETSS